MRYRLVTNVLLLLALAVPASAQVTGMLAPVAKQQFFDNSGNILADGLVYTYTAGTSTPLATYTDAALSVPNANPIVLDNAGRATIYLTAATYKFVVKTSAGATIYAQDNVAATQLISGGLSATTGVFSSTLSVAGNATLSGTANNVGTITTGVWNAGAVTSSGAITAGAAITAGSVNNAINATYTLNGESALINLRNANASNAAIAAMFIGNNTSSSAGSFRVYGSGYSTSGSAIADSLRIGISTAGGLTLAADHASGPIRFYAGGTTLRAQINTAGTQTWAAYGAGTATFDGSGNITSVSDVRYKDRIAPLPYGLAAVLQLKPVQHGYNALSELDRKHLYGGFLAQDVQKVMPLAIGVDARGYLTLSDRPILGAVVNSIQELDARLRAMERKRR